MGHALHPYENLHVHQGDIHNHCRLIYGHKDLADGLKMPELSLTLSVLCRTLPGRISRKTTLTWILVAFHRYGFKKLKNIGENNCSRWIVVMTKGDLSPFTAMDGTAVKPETKVLISFSARSTYSVSIQFVGAEEGS